MAQTGKLHFGVVLGWSVVGSTVVWFVANNIGGGSADAPDGGAPGLYDCCCLLGYCLLPLIVHALVLLLIPKCGPALCWSEFSGPVTLTSGAACGGYCLPPLSLCMRLYRCSTSSASPQHLIVEKADF